MRNMTLIVILFAGWLMSACGGGGGGGSSAGDGWVVGWHGVLDLVSRDLNGSQRAKPGAMGALEAN